MEGLRKMEGRDGRGNETYKHSIQPYRKSNVSTVKVRKGTFVGMSSMC